MADAATLILKKFESGMLAAMPRAQPDTVFVLSYADGKLRTFQRAPGLADRTGSKWCYVVDRSQRFSVGELRIPAYGGVYFFKAWYDAAWQVTDAAAVVAANLQAGEPVVEGFLKSALWPLGRRFDAGDVEQAEQTIVQSLQPPLSVGSGLTLNGLSLRLAVDSRQVHKAIADDAEVRRQQQVQARVSQLQMLLPNAEPALILHVATHPDDTAAGLELFNQTRQHDANYRLALLDRMFANGILTDADGDVLRQMVLGGSAAPALPPSSGPAPQSMPALGSGTPSAAAPALGGGGGWNVPVLGTTSATPAAPALPAGTPQATPSAPSTPPPWSGPSGSQHRPAAAAGWPPAQSPGGPQDQPPGVRGPGRSAPGLSGPQDQPPGVRGPGRSAPGLSGPQDQPPGVRAPGSPSAPGVSGPQDQPVAAERAEASPDQDSRSPGKGAVKRWKSFGSPKP